MEIRVRDVRKTFSGAAAALNGVSLDVVSGELVALLGPSGSGKTTLLRVIAGLEKPSAGEVFFGDQPATTLSVQQRRVGFVFQHYALFKHLTVLDNIGYGMRVRPRAQRPSREDIRARVLELLDLVQLTGLEGRYPAQLSGGQRQRVALARALAVEPRVLLLDEPFGALDAKVRKDLRRWLRAIHDKTGHTTLFVTHDQEEALELADRVAVLDKGRIEQIGTPDDIYERPASPFVFGFIGESSVIPVEIRSGRALFDGRPLGVAADGLDDGPGHLHLRPQDGRLAAAGNPGLPGRLLGIRRTASNRRAEVALGTGGPVIEVDIAPESALARGDEIAIDIARGRVFKRPV